MTSTARTHQGRTRGSRSETRGDAPPTIARPVPRAPRAPRVGTTVNLEPLFTRTQIRRAVGRIARTIDLWFSTQDHNGGRLVLVPVLNGALYFAADLSRALNTPHLVEPVKLRSYVGTRKAAKRIDLDIKADLRPEDVIVLVDDIVDTGDTLAALVRHLEKTTKVQNVRAVALLKRRAFKATHNEVLATGLEVEHEFVVGYGLDIDGELRQLDYVAKGVVR